MSTITRHTTTKSSVFLYYTGSPAAPEEQLEDGGQDVLRDGAHLDRRRPVLRAGESLGRCLHFPGIWPS